MELPDKTKDLIEVLEETFEVKSLKPGDNIEEAIFYSGKLDLIAWIKHNYENNK